MKKIVLGIFALGFSVSLFAHSQYLYTETLDLSEKNSVKLSVLFGHPSEGNEDGGIDVAIVDGQPTATKEFFVVKDGKEKTDLKSKLKEGKIVTDKNTARTLEYNFTQAEGLKGKGLWTFIAVPGQTKDEGYTFNFANKLIVVKEGASGGWTSRVADGYPEIIPYSNPATMWKENVFRAVVVDAKGNPVPDIRIDVEFLNAKVDLTKGTYKGGGELEKVDTKVYTDKDGVFAFVPSRAGQWILRARVGMDRENKIADSASLVVEFK